MDGDLTAADDGDAVADARAVVARHLAAVRAGDPEAMAADYAAHATLLRGADRYEGHAAILRYFRSLSSRLAGGEVVFGPSAVDGDRVVFPWRIDGGPADGTVGRDVCLVRGGRIVHQVVELSDADF